MIEPSLIDQLVQIGRSGDPTNPKTAILLLKVKPHDRINRLAGPLAVNPYRGCGHRCIC